MEETALQIVSQPQLPSYSLASTAMTLNEAMAQRQLIAECVKAILIEGIDYGPIPGTQRQGEVIKNVLLKPGAEKLCNFFRLWPKCLTLNEERDRNTGFAFYRYECQLVHIPTNTPVGSGIGQCTSYESKYRYRYSQRQCPSCGKEAIIQGKAEYGGGWICFKKKGGCGAKYHDDHPDIINQKVGQVENEHLIDQWNTVDKMAQKRALIAAVLITVGASDYFTQDMELEENILPVSAGSGQKEEGLTARNDPPPAPTDSVAFPPSESIQKPVHCQLPFETISRGRAEVLSKLNHAIDLKCGTAKEILTRAFGKDYSPPMVAKETELDALQKAYDVISGIIFEAKQ